MYIYSLKTNMCHVYIFFTKIELLVKINSAIKERCSAQQCCCFPDKKLYLKISHATLSHGDNKIIHQVFSVPKCT